MRPLAGPRSAPRPAPPRPIRAGAALPSLTHLLRRARLRLILVPASLLRSCLAAALVAAQRGVHEGGQQVVQHRLCQLLHAAILPRHSPLQLCLKREQPAVVAADRGTEATAAAAGGRGAGEERVVVGGRGRTGRAAGRRVPGGGSGAGWARHPAGGVSRPGCAALCPQCCAAPLHHCAAHLCIAAALAPRAGPPPSAITRGHAVQRRLPGAWRGGAAGGAGGGARMRARRSVARRGGR
jgi:hypothetical protein